MFRKVRTLVSFRQRALTCQAHFVFMLAPKAKPAAATFVRFHSLILDSITLRINPKIVRNAPSLHCPYTHETMPKAYRRSPARIGRGVMAAPYRSFAVEAS